MSGCQTGHETPPRKPRIYRTIPSIPQTAAPKKAIGGSSGNFMHEDEHRIGDGDDKGVDDNDGGGLMDIDPPPPDQDPGNEFNADLNDLYSSHSLEPPGGSQSLDSPPMYKHSVGLSGAERSTARAPREGRRGL